MRPWAEPLAERGYAVEVPLLPGHGTRWQDLNRGRWERLVRRGRRAPSTSCRADCDAVVVGGPLDGRLGWRCAWPRTARPTSPALVLVNPSSTPTRKDVQAAAGAQARRAVASPASPTTSRSRAMDEHGYTRTPLKAVPRLIRTWQAGRRPTCRRSPSRCCYFRSREDHVVDTSSRRASCSSGLLARRHEERVLEDSYHVATLDNDAETDLRRVRRLHRPRHALPDALRRSGLVRVSESVSRRATTTRPGGSIVENYGDRAAIVERPSPARPPSRSRRRRLAPRSTT